MSILDELDELHQLDSLEKEAALIPNLRTAARSLRGTVKKLPTAAASPAVKQEASYAAKQVSAGPAVEKKVSSVPTPGPTSLKTSFSQKGTTTAPSTTTTAAVDRSTMKVDSAPTTPTGSGELGLMGKLKYKVKSMRQSLNGNTTSARRTKAEKFEKGQVDTMKGVHKDPAVTEATPKSTAPVDRSNMEVTPAQGGKPIGETKAPETKAPETETDAPKWYKNKDTMKGVGIGAAGVAAVGVGAKVMSDRKGQDSGSRPSGYY